jgi:hypothetical protein
MRADPSFLAVMVAACVALIGVLVIIENNEQRQWEMFAETHDCKTVGRMRSVSTPGVGVGVVPGGRAGVVVTTVTTPEMTGYICNDGITCWR